MKPLVLDSTMTNVGGVFYPTGQVFALFPDEDCARQAALALHAAGHQDDIAYASPEVILQEIVHTQGTADSPIPSVGAEGDMVRRIADLAGTGHHGMLITVADSEAVNTVVNAIAPEGAVTAFYYRTFIVEDLITQPASDSKQPAAVETRAKEG